MLNNVQFLEPLLVSPVGASGGFEPDGRPTTYRRALGLLETGRVEVGPFVTHRYTRSTRSRRRLRTTGQRPTTSRASSSSNLSNPTNPSNLINRRHATCHVHPKDGARRRRPAPARCCPMISRVLNFAVAVDASADVPLGAWFDLDDEWLPKVRQIHDALAKNAARVETLPRGSVLSRADLDHRSARARAPESSSASGSTTGITPPRATCRCRSSPVTFSKYVTSVTGPAPPDRVAADRPGRWTTKPSWRSSSAAAPSTCPSSAPSTTCSAT